MHSSREKLTLAAQPPQPLASLAIRSWHNASNALLDAGVLPCYAYAVCSRDNQNTHAAASCATAAAAIAKCPTQKLLLLSGPKLTPGAAPTGWQLPTVPSACSDTAVRQPQDLSTTGVNMPGSRSPADMPYAMA